jgi:hypothetical protein
MDHGINFYQNKCATGFYRKSALDKENQFADQRSSVYMDGKIDNSNVVL